MKDDMQVNPWDVKGHVDYERLMREFGIKPLLQLPKEFHENLLFRRGKVFAQRDFSRIVDAVKNKKPFVVMTGLVPNGSFHIGHAIVARQLAFYQKLGARLYICVADIEAYNARGQDLKTSKDIAEKQYLPGFKKMGVTTRNCEIYFQSARCNDSKKANAYYRLQNLLANHATFNEFRAVYGEITPGKMVSALIQASDMLHPMLPEFEGNIPVLVPVGVDQDPHLRLARDMAKRLKLFNFTPLSSTYNKFMPGLQGGKMSASNPASYVSFTDTPSQIRKKVNKYAFSGGQSTVEEHRKKGGNPDVDVSYQWLTFLEEDDSVLENIEQEYRSGKLLSGELKKIVIEKLISLL